MLKSFFVCLIRGEAGVKQGRNILEKKALINKRLQLSTFQSRPIEAKVVAYEHRLNVDVISHV